MCDLNDLFYTKKNNKIIQKKDTEIAQKQLPWVEKYRPKHIDQIMYQNEAVILANNILATGNLPHLLFHGPPGTGKTSMILAIARQLFGPRLIKTRVLELNASDERGIRTVRDKVLTYAKTAIGDYDPNFPSPPFKLIILDEADAMTTDAQMALRKILEDYSRITRICFICNYINQIIGSIISRCVCFRFKPLDFPSMRLKINDICIKETIQIDKDAIELLIKYSNGDMRRMISQLQNIKYSYSVVSKISSDVIYDITNSITKTEITRIMNICMGNNVTHNKVIKEAKNIIAYGYDLSNIYSEITDFIATTNKLTDTQKSLICFAINTIDDKLFYGSDEYIQLLHILMMIMNVNKKIVTKFPEISLI
jgi:replication factor C subunit 2/4